MKTIRLEIFDGSTGLKQDIFAHKDKTIMQIPDDCDNNFYLCVNDKVYEIDQDGELVKCFNTIQLIRE
jgi:hypothetical protein